MLLSLYSLCQTGDGETDGECLRQLRTALSGLSDDSLKEMPRGGYAYKMVSKGSEGVDVTITPINAELCREGGDKKP